jgi:thiol:disulfide interchange protein DsbC
VRIGTELFYSDEQGNHIFQGSLIDTRTRTNLTEARIDKLTAVDFASLPLKDAVVIKQGNGARKLAVFVDPNCGYCKRFERDLTTVKDVTIYTFLYPILGPDSNVKSRDIWCSKDAAKTWRSWMIDGAAPVKTMGQCDSAALDRNVEFGRKYRVQGTPALFFEDGTRKPGALPAAEVEKLLVSAKKT